MNPTRRFFALGAAMLPLAPAGMAAAPPNLDAELLAACADYRRIKAQCDAAEAAMDAASVEGAQCIFDECNEGLWPEQLNVVDRITAMPARTPEGLTAKARILRVELAFWGASGGEPIEEAGDTQEKLAWSLVNDLLGRA